MLLKIFHKKISITFDIKFKVSAETVFDFIIKPTNMPLYTGFFLAPGIQSVRSSDSIRKVGTIDYILNTDGSSHQSKTIELVRGKTYDLVIFNIETKGWKKIFDFILEGFEEKWSFNNSNDSSFCMIHRKLVIKFKLPLLFIFPSVIFVYWVFKNALHNHHLNLESNLS